MLRQFRIGCSTKVQTQPLFRTTEFTTPVAFPANVADATPQMPCHATSGSRTLYVYCSASITLPIGVCPIVVPLCSAIALAPSLNPDQAHVFAPPFSPALQIALLPIAMPVY